MNHISSGASVLRGVDYGCILEEAEKRPMSSCGMAAITICPSIDLTS